MGSTPALRIGVLGTGLVGRRLARELVELDVVGTVVLLSGHQKRMARLRDSLGPRAVVRSGESRPDTDDLDLSDLDIVVLCTRDEDQPDQARRALTAGCHVVSTADAVASVELLLGLDEFARDVDRCVVVGATLSPGLSALLSCHAASLFDEVDEISVAVVGTGGPSCVERRTRAARTDTQEWRDGTWVECAARSGSELAWFPDPIGAVDCARGDLSEAILLRRVLPAVPQLVVKMGRPTARPVSRRMERFGRSAAQQEQGGVRVAVSGRIDGEPSTVVYGMVAPAADGSGVLAAIAAESVARTPHAGAFGVAELVEPLTALQRASARGVRTMVFEGND